MPFAIYADDVVVNGDDSYSDQIQYFASLFAIFELGVESQLSGQPPIFTPIHVSPTVMAQFHALFAQHQARFAEAISTALPQ